MDHLDVMSQPVMIKHVPQVVAESKCTCKSDRAAYPALVSIV